MFMAKCSFHNIQTKEFVPMVWSGSDTAANFKLTLQQSIIPALQGGNVHRVLGFNEPDKVEQANMSVNKALGRWPALESLNVPLVSPSCAHPNQAWMKQFMWKAQNLCLRVDYVGVHWYKAPNFAAFKTYMTHIYQTYKKPLMITEFAVADWNAKTVQENRYSQSMVLNFMKEALPWLERTPWIAGYAWFNFPQSRAVGTSSALYDANGQLTTVGRYYQSVRKDKRQGDQSITIVDF
jgi:Glycosyl hydrolase catalytic core